MFFIQFFGSFLVIQGIVSLDFRFFNDNAKRTQQKMNPFIFIVKVPLISDKDTTNAQMYNSTYIKTSFQIKKMQKYLVL